MSWLTDEQRERFLCAMEVCARAALDAHRIREYREARIRAEATPKIHPAEPGRQARARPKLALVWSRD